MARLFRRIDCLVVVMLSVICFSGEIVYQDYLAESDLLTVQDTEAGAMVNVLFDWNYFFDSDSLSVALKIKYGMDEGTNVVFRPIVARYDFDGVRDPVRKSLRRVDACYRYLMPCGFCMVGLDSFLFSHGRKQNPETAFMSISDSTHVVNDITRDIGGRVLHGALSASERAVFPESGCFAFQCLENATGWSLLLWNNGVKSLLPAPSRLRGYSCLSDGRVIFDELCDSQVGTIPVSSFDREVFAHVYCVADCRASDATANVYADWKTAQSNKIMSLGKDDLGRCSWSIRLHGLKGICSGNELGHEFVEGRDAVYDFSGWKVFRIRRNDSDWQSFDLREFFSNDIGQAEESVEIPIVHRGLDSWYYALLFECRQLGDGCNRRYRIRIVEVPRKGDKICLWSFPDFGTKKKLTTFMTRSPGVVHKLSDDSWVFLSSTATFTNDAIFVQRMIGARSEMQPVFTPLSTGLQVPPPPQRASDGKMRDAAVCPHGDYH